MKRIQMKNHFYQNDISLPQNLTDYVAGLKLLYDVPFSYLIADENSLPPESIRFFYIDGEWTKALVEGALSIGRATESDAVHDKLQLSHSFDSVNNRLGIRRFVRMHDNHKSSFDQFNTLTESTIQTGFIMRSVLTRRMKGLEVTGKSGNKDLEILRMETLSDDVLICIFGGEITNLVISEPRVGLRLGCPDNSHIIEIRKTDDDDDFGQYMDEKVNVGEFTQENGRLKVSELAEKIGTILDGTEKKSNIGSAKFAFELIATAHRMEFEKNEATDHTN